MNSQPAAWRTASGSAECTAVCTRDGASAAKRARAAATASSTLSASRAPSSRSRRVMVRSSSEPPARYSYSKVPLVERPALRAAQQAPVGVGEFLLVEGRAHHLQPVHGRRDGVLHRLAALVEGPAAVGDHRGRWSRSGVVGWVTALIAALAPPGRSESPSSRKLRACGKVRLYLPCLTLVTWCLRNRSPLRDDGRYATLPWQNDSLAGLLGEAGSDLNALDWSRG